MMQALPPAEVSSAPTAPPSEIRETFTLVSRSREGTLTRAPVSEEVILIQHTFMSVSLKPKVIEAVADRRCSWLIRTFMQRQFCFRSITGLTSCTEAVTMELPETAEGDLSLGSDVPPDEAVCDANFLPMTRARDRLSSELRQRSPVLFDEDLRLRATAVLTTNGVRVRWRNTGGK